MNNGFWKTMEVNSDQALTADHFEGLQEKVTLINEHYPNSEVVRELEAALLKVQYLYNMAFDLQPISN